MTTSNPMIEGRRADSARRRQRVIKAINEASATGGEISVSAIARAAGVDRTFLYRHTDLLGQVHTAQAHLVAADGGGPVVSRASLQADLANATARSPGRPLASGNWRPSFPNCSESKPGASPVSARPPTSTNSNGGSPGVDLRNQLEQRDHDLAAARTANRELITNLNKRS